MMDIFLLLNMMYIIGIMEYWNVGMFIKVIHFLSINPFLFAPTILPTTRS